MTDSQRGGIPVFQAAAATKTSPRPRKAGSTPKLVEKILDVIVIWVLLISGLLVWHLCCLECACLSLVATVYIYIYICRMYEVSYHELSTNKVARTP